MGVPVLPKDSGVLGKGVLGDMVLGADYTPITDLTQPYPAHQVVPINIYTTAMVQCGIVDDYEHLKHVENLYDFDTFEIRSTGQRPTSRSSSRIDSSRSQQMGANSSVLSTANR